MHLDLYTQGGLTNNTSNIFSRMLVLAAHHRLWEWYKWKILCHCEWLWLACGLFVACLWLACGKWLVRMIQMKISFPKRAKHYSIKWACNANAKFKDLILVIEIFTYVYMCIYSTCTYLWRALSQNMTSELGIGTATSIFGLALNAF